VVQENGGYLGGLLVVNEWGRPLEFRLTSTVTPTRIHRILYGDTLLPFIYSDLIGRSLVEKTALPLRMLITDVEPLLAIRPHVGVPVFLLRPPELQTPEAGLASRAGVLVTHPEYAADLKEAQEDLQPLQQRLELGEPFERIREALGEARKMGAHARAA